MDERILDLLRRVQMFLSVVYAKSYSVALSSWAEKLLAEIEEVLNRE